MHKPERGYRPATVEDHVRLLAQLSCWLPANRLGESALTPDAIEEFVHTRQRDGRTHLFSSRAVAPLLGYLWRLGVVAEPVAQVACTPAERLCWRSFVHTWSVSEALWKGQFGCTRTLAGCS